MKYQRGNKVLEFSYPLLSIPFLNELVVTHDGYIISCADDIHYKYLDKIALPNVNIVKNSFAEILQARHEFILTKNYLNILNVYNYEDTRNCRCSGG